MRFPEDNIPIYGHKQLLWGWATSLSKSKKIINSIVNPSKNTEDIKEKNVENESIIIGYSTNNTLLNPTCLERSLFTYLILCLYGINCDLKIGINNSSNEFSAHAWIEYKNRVINDNNDQIKNFSTF